MEQGRRGHAAASLSTNIYVASEAIRRYPGGLRHGFECEHQTGEHKGCDALTMCGCVDREQIVMSNFEAGAETIPVETTSMRRNLLVYIAALGLFAGGVYFLLGFGAKLQPSTAVISERGTASSFAPKPLQPRSEIPIRSLSSTLSQNLQHPLSLLLMQVIVILVAARLAGAFFRKIRQPVVIGEMVAGIILGPSILGTLSPAVHVFLFPASSLDFLKVLGQLGVILFMFIV